MDIFFIRVQYSFGHLLNVKRFCFSQNWSWALLLCIRPEILVFVERSYCKLACSRRYHANQQGITLITCTMNTLNTSEQLSYWEVASLISSVFLEVEVEQDPMNWVFSPHSKKDHMKDFTYSPSSPLRSRKNRKWSIWFHFNPLSSTKKTSKQTNIFLWHSEGPIPFWRGREKCCLWQWL